eukprot:11597032-Ditylum_brightwellii.AAC.1
MAASINDTTKAVMMTAVGVDEIPAYAFDLATLPEHQNGLGLYNPATSSVLSFLIPFIRCLRYALQ